MMNPRQGPSLRTIRAHLLRRHRSGYTGVAVSAALAALVLSCTLNSALLAARSHRYTGDPYFAARWNMGIDLMSSFNWMMMVMAGLAAAASLASTAAFALEPRIGELSRLSLVGMTRREILRLTGQELMFVVLGGSLLGTIAGVPAALGYLELERRTGLAPAQLPNRLLATAFLAALLISVVIGVIGGLRPVLQIAGTRVLDTQDRIRATRRHRRRHTVLSIGFTVLAVALILVPDSVMPSDVSVLFAIPVLAVAVTMNGAVIIRAITACFAGLTRADHRPRALVASRNVGAAGGKALSATQAIVLAVSLLVPLSMVMATGRQNEEIEASEPLHSSAIAVFDADLPTPEVLADVNATLGDDPLVPYATLPDVVLARDPFSSSPPGVLLTDLASLATQIDVKASEGDLAAVTGDQVATASTRWAVGDEVTVLSSNGGTRKLTITAAISPDSDSYLSSDLILDYATNADLVGQDAVFRTFSSSAPADVARALASHGVDDVRVVSRDAWVQEAVDGATSSQRQALTMIFALPSLMAAVATVLGIRSYASLTRRSRTQLWSMGFTRRDLRTEYLIEVGLQLAVIAVEITASLALAWWKVSRIIDDQTSSNVAVSFDLPVAAIAGGLLLLVFFAGHALQYAHTTRRHDIA